MEKNHILNFVIQSDLFKKGYAKTPQHFKRHKTIVDSLSFKSFGISVSKESLYISSFLSIKEGKCPEPKDLLGESFEMFEILEKHYGKFAFKEKFFCYLGESEEMKGFYPVEEWNSFEKYMNHAKSFAKKVDK
jgi:hypothetical protein